MPPNPTTILIFPSFCCWLPGQKTNTRWWEETVLSRKEIEIMFVFILVFNLSMFWKYVFSTWDECCEPGTWSWIIHIVYTAVGSKSVATIDIIQLITVSDIGFFSFLISVIQPAMQSHLSSIHIDSLELQAKVLGIFSSVLTHKHFLLVFPQEHI